MLFEAMEGAHVVHFIGAKKPWTHTGGRFRRGSATPTGPSSRESGPSAPPLAAGLAPHRNRRYLREVLIRHTLAVGRFCDYLDRFENDLTVLNARQETRQRTWQTARAWQRMLSGRRLDLLDPSPLDVEVEDIAHGLAFVARWNGQTRGEHPYSVAEHSLLVEEIFGMIADRLRGALADGGAAARCAGVRDRRHDLAGEGRGRARVRRARRPAGAGGAYPLRPAGGDTASW